MPIQHCSVQTEGAAEAEAATAVEVEGMGKQKESQEQQQYSRRQQKKYDMTTAVLEHLCNVV